MFLTKHFSQQRGALACGGVRASRSLTQVCGMCEVYKRLSSLPAFFQFIISVRALKKSSSSSRDPLKAEEDEPARSVRVFLEGLSRTYTGKNAEA